MKRVLFAAMTAIAVSCAAHESDAKIKRSNLAGNWYPARADALAAEIDRLLAAAQEPARDGEPVMLILPHAGYQYSGAVAAAGYRLLGSSGRPRFVPEIIVILAPSHYSSFDGCSALEADEWETPLGRVKLARRLAERLRGGVFVNAAAVHEAEHAVEIHLPFLQRIYRDRLQSVISVLPIVVGSVDAAARAEAASKLAAAVAGKKAIVIASSDFTHYGARFGYMPFGRGPEVARRVKELDEGAIARILARDAAGFASYIERTGATVCGWRPIAIALSLPMSNVRAARIAYDTSASVTGEVDESVGYAAIAFFESGIEGSASSRALSDADRAFLLRLARDNISSWLSKGKGIRIDPSSVPVSCRAPRGVFVTLKKHGALRGCIGFVTPDKPLAEAVIESSFNAAFRDPRFSPLTSGELKDIDIEISVLTPPEPVASLADIVPGRDGLIVEKGMMRGLLLPQVAVEQGWGRDEFAAHTCMKAGLPASCVRDPAVKFFRFRAEVFGEKEKR